MLQSGVSKTDRPAKRGRPPKNATTIVSVNLSSKTHSTRVWKHDADEQTPAQRPNIVSTGAITAPEQEVRAFSTFFESEVSFREATEINFDDYVWNSTSFDVVADEQYCRLLEAHSNSLVRINENNHRTALFAVMDFNNSAQCLDEGRALAVIFRNIKRLGGFTIHSICDCDRDCDHLTGIRSPASFLFEDRVNWTELDILTMYGADTIQRCIHRRAVLRLITKDSDPGKQLRFLTGLLKPEYMLLEPDATIPRVVANFFLTRKDHVTGNQRKCPVALGLRNQSLALGYWNGGRLKCLTCNSGAECGHFRAHIHKYRDQGLHVEYDAHCRSSEVVPFKLPPVAKQYPDPGMFSVTFPGCCRNFSLKRTNSIDFPRRYCRNIFGCYLKKKGHVWTNKYFGH